MDADAFIEKHRTALEKNHGWELRFVDTVLRHVPGLDFAFVEHEKLFRDRDGKRRRIDFTITEPSGVKIALEVDGYDKTGRGTGASRGEFVDGSRRQQDIVSQGWRGPLRFANADVRDVPERCIDSIAWTLTLERQLAERAKADPQVAALKKKLDEHERRSAEDQAKLAVLLSAKNRREAGDRSALHEAQRAAASERSELRRAREAAAAQLLSAEQAQQLAADESRRAREDVAELERVVADAESRAQRAEWENRGMKFIAGVFAVIAVAVAVIVVVSSGSGGSASNGTPAAADPSGCASALDWTKAGDFVGRSGSFRGPVVSATYRGRAKGQPTFLNIGAPYGDPRRLVVVVWGRNRSKFDAPERQYDGAQVAVTGTVRDYRGVAQIEVNTPSAIERCP